MKQYNNPNALPPAFIKHVEGLFDTLRPGWAVAIHQHLIRHLEYWRETGDPMDAVPGYDTPPPNAPNLPFPRGWSSLNLARLCKKKGESFRDKPAIEKTHNKIHRTTN